MAVNPRTYVTNDKKIPASMSGDAGKVLAVNSGETAYEHAGSTTGILTGTIIMWATNIAPAGYLICDGAQYDTSQYPALSAILGENAPGTFVVPDINFAKNSNGINTLAKEDSDVESHQHDITPIPDHNHSLAINGAPNHRHDTWIPALRGINTSEGAWAVQAATEYTYTGYAGAHGHTGLTDWKGGYSPTTTGDVGTVTQPACTLLTFCIKV